MTKTVKEIEQIQDIIDFICFKHQTNVDDKLIKLYEIRNKMLYYENELAEKDKQLEIMNEQCDGAIRKILEQQLYKEDFEDVVILDTSGHCSPTAVYRKALIDNSKYDKLPSKDVK